MCCSSAPGLGFLQHSTCLFKNRPMSWVSVKRFYTARLPATKREGHRCFVFNKILTVFIIGDGWLEKHGKGVRLGIS
jgi:hypothetical protein